VIARLAVHVASVGDRRIEVRGHTDTNVVPEKVKATVPSSWELSSLHAAAVARKLIEGAKLKEHFVTVSGAASGQPRDKSTSAKSKARNRRVEVVIATLATPAP